MGGYLAGRLRTKWVHVHTDEVYFRDTAHGFLAWAVALVITAAFLASAASSMVGARTSIATESRVTGARFEALPGLVPTNISSIPCSGRIMQSSTQWTAQCAARSDAFLQMRFDKGIWRRRTSYLGPLIAWKCRPAADADKAIIGCFEGLQQAAGDRPQDLGQHSLLWTFLALSPVVRFARASPMHQASSRIML